VDVVQRQQNQLDTVVLQTEIVHDHRQTARGIVENVGSVVPNTVEPGATSPADQLHRQAQNAVQRLNHEGAGLPVAETAASLAAAAAEAGLRRIDDVRLGTPQNGTRNLIVLEGDPNDAATKRAVVDSREAAQTPPGESLQRLHAATGEQRNPPAEQRMDSQQQTTDPSPRGMGGR
jgi:hypothetical protein